MQNFNQTKNHSKVASFIAKLVQVLQDPAFKGIIQWNFQNGGFGILNLDKFRQEILPKYFKHSNIASFVRQLNMYCFQKVWNRKFALSYAHKYFIKDQPHLLRKIKRKKQHKNDPWKEESECQDEILREMELMKKKSKELEKLCIKSIQQTNQAIKQSYKIMNQTVQAAYNHEFLQKVYKMMEIGLPSQIQEGAEIQPINVNYFEVEPKNNLLSQLSSSQQGYEKFSNDTNTKFFSPNVVQEKQYVLL